MYVKACIIYARADGNHTCSHIHIVSLYIMCERTYERKKKKVSAWERERERETACMHVLMYEVNENKETWNKQLWFSSKEERMCFVHMSSNNLFWCFERDRMIEFNKEYMLVRMGSEKKWTSSRSYLSIGSICALTTLLMNRLSLSAFFFYPASFCFHAEQSFFFYYFQFSVL